METIDGDKLETMLQIQEGYKQFKYKDTKGIETIGYGRNLQAKGISKEEALYLLKNDIKEAENAVLKNWPFYAKLCSPRQAAVIDLVFNMGIGGLMGFRNMLRNLEAGNYIAASHDLLDSNYPKDVGESRSTTIARIIETGKI